MTLTTEVPVALCLDDVLQRVLDLGGSDLHLTAGVEPSVRVNGELIRLTEFPVATDDEIRRMVYAILTPKQRERFEDELELDLSYTLSGKSRFRVNVFVQRDSIGTVCRAIPFEIRPLDALGLPPVVASFADLPRGLVLVTGPTGSGKSTTLAALVDDVNSSRKGHIVTIEDPIEFTHARKQCLISQREVGFHARSFASALHSALREDPDAILVGEMRDLETISLAITAAETGILVFGTLHTNGAASTVDRMVNVFPPADQPRVRTMLSTSLVGVVSQQLVRKADGRGRIAALEIFVNNPAVANLIREGKTEQIPSAIQGGGLLGMQSLDGALRKLVDAKLIAGKEAYEKAISKRDFERYIYAAA